MTDNINKLMAEALVECGYATSWAYASGWNPRDDGKLFVRTSTNELIDPFANTFEGRRQADALEDWLHNEHYNLIQQAKVAEMLQKDNPNNDFMGQYNGRQKRLNRIKWYFEQLAEKSHD